MTTLQRRALARLPLTEAEVGRVYDGPPGSTPAVRALCESHERLRAELRGAAALHEESTAALRDAAADLAAWEAEVSRLRAACELIVAGWGHQDGVSRAVEAAREALAGEPR